MGCARYRVRHWLTVACWRERRYARRPYLRIINLQGPSDRYAEPIPSTHRSFSRLEFAHISGDLAEIAQEDEAVPDEPAAQREDRPLAEADDSVTGHYLSDDDIEEW